MGNFKREQKWFWKNHKNLLKKYEGKFVVVYGNTVVDSGYDQIALLNNFYKEYGYVECFCHLVLEKEPSYSVWKTYYSWYIF